MAFQRNAGRSGLILLAAIVAIIAVMVGFPRARPTQDTFSGVRVAVPPQPNWAALTAEQKTILAPLKEDWNNMERFRQKKWLEIAARYAQLSPSEQERVQDRMQDWANLTPAQRQAARERYRQLNLQTNTEEREALAQKWTDYQNLPPEVRARLEKQARDQERASKRAARTPAVDGKAIQPVTTKEGTLPTGTVASTLANAPGSIKVVPPKAAAPAASPLTFAPPSVPMPEEAAPPPESTSANDSR